MDSKSTQQAPPSEKPSISLAYLIYLIVFLVATCWSAWRLVYFIPERQQQGDDEAAIQQLPPNEHTSLLNSSRHNSTETQLQKQAQVQGNMIASGGLRAPADVHDEHHGTGLIQTRTLDPRLLPGDATTNQFYPNHNRRLIIIGDVHGCRATLEALLEKVVFQPDNDHLIFVGDLINKGPDSLGVVDLARRYNASAVRGNHEDRILKIRKEMDLDGESDENDEDNDDDGGSDDEGDEDDDGNDSEDKGEESDCGKKSKKDKRGKDKDKKEKKDKKAKKKDKKKDKDKDKDKKKDKKDKKDEKDKKSKKGKKKKDKKGKGKGKGENPEKEARERNLAALLPNDQVQWLESCPIILRVGPIRGMGEVVVVHGGVVPGVELEKQDPEHVMNMRSIDEKNAVLDSPKGTMWAKLFNGHQSKLYSKIQKTETDPTFKLMTIIYGHDARSGLAIEEYTKGLDSGCVKGEKLTALVIEGGGKQSLVHVKCYDDIEKE